ncbi:MAG: hypothetical protein RR382_08705 [Tannerellaceae bacterium]
MIKDLYIQDCHTAIEDTIKIPFDFSDKSNVPDGVKLNDEIVITPITVRTWFKIKSLLIQIDTDDIQKMVCSKDEPYPAHAEEIIAKYDDIILDILCIGIHNKKSDPPEWFREVLKDNSRWGDLFILLNAVLFRIGYPAFCKSITVLRNVSPLTMKEMIAFTTNLESWKEHRKAVLDF